MKKTKLLFMLTALFCVLWTQKSSAQITSMGVSGIDSLRSYCAIPSVDDYTVYGNVKGIVGTTDTADVNVNFGDGFDTTVKMKIYPISGGGSFSGIIRHTYTFPGTFNHVIRASVPSGAADSFTDVSFTLSSTCAVLAGRLYVDDNSNCIKDAIEKGVQWTPILAINTSTSDTSVAGWSNDTGYYYMNLLPGTYTIVPNPVHYGSYGSWVDTNLVPSCPSTGTYTLTVVASGTYSKDFAYSCKTISSYDASIVTSARCFVPGDSTLIHLWGGSWSWYYFYTCMSLSTTVTLTLDSKLTYLSSCYGAVPSSVSGSTITWTLSSTKDVTRFYSGIWVKTATTATIGDTIRNTAYIAPTAYTDPNLANNTHNYKKAVSSSYDPNVKEVAPAGYSANGYIPKNAQLTYTIHFQNTGTAAAKNVTISDNIDNNLDLSSLHLLNATHNASMYVSGRTVKFRFENINLPDSGTNMAGSMGAITYGILPKKGIAAGNTMKNTAAIYFDYNAPIITNTTLNTIELSTGIQNVSLGAFSAKIFPNPANTELNIKAESSSNYTVNMLDMLGRTVAYENSNNGTVVIPTQNLGNGTYLVYIRDDKGNQLSTKVLVKH
jgi:hypothetical protein